MYPLGWGDSHPGPHCLHLHRLQRKCWQRLPVETCNSTSGSPSLFPLFQDHPGQGIKDGMHQPERAVQQEYFVSWNSLRCADDPPNSWGVTREMSIRKPGPALGEGAACSHGGAGKLLPSAQNHPRGYHWSEKNTSETAHPLIQILLQTGWKFGNYPDVLSHLSRMDSLERNQKLNKWENFIPFLSSDRLSQAESWEFRSVHPRLNMPWEY